MNPNHIIPLLERIASALERIAESMEKETSSARVHNAPPVRAETHAAVNGKKTSSDFPGSVVGAFLEGRGVRIKSLPDEDAADDVLNSIAEFIGKNYDTLDDFLNAIKRNMQFGHTVTLPLKNASQQGVSNVCQLAKRLHDIAFLEEYIYFKAPQYLLKARPATMPKAQNFFSGRWLERYVFVCVRNAVNRLSNQYQAAVDFDYIMNPQVILPNGNDFELDLIFHINGMYFWIEAKSGNYQQHIAKYAKIARILNVDVRHAVMVPAGVSAEQCSALTALFSMTVLPVLQLPDALSELLQGAFVRKKDV